MSVATLNTLIFLADLQPDHVNALLFAHAISGRDFDFYDTFRVQISQADYSRDKNYAYFFTKVSSSKQSTYVAIFFIFLTLALFFTLQQSFTCKMDSITNVEHKQEIELKFGVFIFIAFYLSDLLF